MTTVRRDRTVRSQASAPDWYTLPLAELFERLGSSDEGLTRDEAASRLREYGPNELPHKPPPTWWEILLRQFQSPLIYVLAAAAVISAGVGDVKDAGFIGAVLLINAFIGGYQEWRAEQSALALQKLLKIRASVERDGDVREISAEEVVPGDVLWLESGDRVPADLRLLSAHGFEVDESLLTGESVAVTKDPAWTGREATPLGDRLNMVFAGSTVARGRAKGVVTETGAGTAIGQLAREVVEAVGGKPPLVERMERFSRAIAVAVLLAAVVVGLMGIVLHDYSLREMFFFAVALAVSAIPEGLPAALTVALAIGTTRMARRGVIVRRLTAVEGLGSCTLVATDKTGTLTVNELTVRELRLPDGQTYELTGQGFAPEGNVLYRGKQVDPAEHVDLERLARAAALCNEADLHHRDGEWAWHGDAVDIAFLSAARKLGYNREHTLDRHPQVNQLPFEPERQYAASYHRMNGGENGNDDFRVFVKGAPERVLAMCALGQEQKEQLHQIAEEMAGRGYRVLAVAEGPVDGSAGSSKAPPEPSELTLLGFAGMIDPLRAGVRDAVQACQQAGVAVTMVTGDHRVTALAIARDLGFAADRNEVMTGTELEAKTEDELRDLVGRIRVFARVAPHQKLQIVQAARAAGHFVAVTGDGVNDAPALRAANIGVAMGRGGTDVAREAAELVISDDNFATIVAGIEEGRIAYGNVRNVIYLLVSTGAAEVVLAGFALAAGMPLPLLPVQLLWLNLVTNGIQGIALAFEPGHGNELRRPPRSPQERIFNRLMIERTIVGAAVMGLVGFAMFGSLLQAGWSEAAARNALLLLMVLFENFHIGNCRSETVSAFRLSPLRTPILLAGAVGAFLLHVTMMYVPYGRFLLETAPVGLGTWGLLVGLALTIFFAMELHKWIWNRRQRRSTPAAESAGEANRRPDRDSGSRDR